MNWSARGNVLNQYLRNTSIGTTVMRAVVFGGNLYDYFRIIAWDITGIATTL
jgi:hypothetical protein